MDQLDRPGPRSRIHHSASRQLERGPRKNSGPILRYLSSDWCVDDGTGASPCVLSVGRHSVVKCRRRLLGAVFPGRRRGGGHEHHGLSGIEPKFGVLEAVRMMLLLQLLIKSLLMEGAGRPVVMVEGHGTPVVGGRGRRRLRQCGGCGLR